MSEKIKILRVRFDKTTLQEAVKTCLKWAKEGKQRYITTPNPEILLEAQRNSKFLTVLNRSDLNIADGVGILWASKYRTITKNDTFKTVKAFKFIKSLGSIPFNKKYIRTELSERVTGTDLMKNICQSTDIPIFLLGAGKGIAGIASEKLKKSNEKLNIIGTHSGSPSIEDEKEIIKRINISGAKILFVAFGAPKQELWIARNLRHLETVKVAIGVGGAFDFIAETKKRAPQAMRKMGLEWLYRVFQEPKRIKRILNATVLFPIKILRKKI